MSDEPFELPHRPDVLPQIEMPLAIQADALGIDRFLIRQGGQPVIDISHASGGIDIGNGYVIAEKLAIASDRGAFGVHGSYAPRDGYATDLYALVRRYGKYLIIPTMLGASTLLADGIITPPISVSSAVEGLKNIEGLENIHTVPIVIAILSGIFFFQRFGTNKVGSIFGPIMLIWFLMLAVLGIYQIYLHPSIVKALNPYYAFHFLTAYPEGFILLGAVFLCVTGAEAMDSDLGHCGKENIRITWVGVKVCLLLNYMGQSAWLMSLGEGALLADRIPFFGIMAPWFLLVGIGISTAAAIIASQALISGSYTLINEANNLNFWPRVAVRQPSEIKGQIYIPSVNIMLWIGCVLVVLYFGNSANMEAAYGLAITITMMVTTYLLSFFLVYRLKWNKVLVFALLMLFMSIEITFFVANLHKFPEGGYITLLISSIFMFIMYSVYHGRKISNRLTKFVDLGRYAETIRCGRCTRLDNFWPEFSGGWIVIANQ